MNFVTLFFCEWLCLCFVQSVISDSCDVCMFLGLLDRRWIEQRDRQMSEKRDQEEVFAPGSSIGSNLKRLAERRTDIFGHGAEEAQIGKKVSHLHYSL